MSNTVQDFFEFRNRTRCSMEKKIGNHESTVCELFKQRNREIQEIYTKYKLLRNQLSDNYTTNVFLNPIQLRAEHFSQEIEHLFQKGAVIYEKDDIFIRQICPLFNNSVPNRTDSLLNLSGITNTEEASLIRDVMNELTNNVFLIECNAVCNFTSGDENILDTEKISFEREDDITFELLNFPDIKLHHSIQFNSSHVILNDNDGYELITSTVSPRLKIGYADLWNHIFKKPVYCLVYYKNDGVQEMIKNIPRTELKHLC
jgi:hypothetical protein